MQPFPESLTRRCYRCKFPIPWSDEPVTTLIGGAAVNMHESCHLAWCDEVAKMTDAEMQGTENAEVK